VERAFPGERARQLREIGTKVSDGMEKFVQVKTAVSAGLALSTAVVLYLFGLRHWLLWSFLFFALNYITYIGSIAACVPPVVLAFLQFESPWAATALAVLVVLNRFFWIDYVEIRLSGKRLNLDSVLLFVWLAYWGWAWGVVGLVLAFPMLHSLKIVLENVDATRRWAVLMGED
jgi:predicted PurR-regulated permease PerM